MTVRGIQWDAQPLGQVPDQVIADSLGCSKEAVHYARAKRGIASAVQPTRRMAGAHLRSPEVLVRVMSTLALEVIAGWQHVGCRCPVELIAAELNRRRGEGMKSGKVR